MYTFHYQMNKKMTQEIATTFQRANDIVQSMNSTEGDGKQFNPFPSIAEYRRHCKYVKKMCDYAQQFSEVNREMIEADKDKKARGKKTRRLNPSQEFIQITEYMEEMVVILKDLRVISMAEVRHQAGVNLPHDQQEKIDEPKTRLRSIIDHFHKLHEMERQCLDLREYKVEQKI